MFKKKPSCPKCGNKINNGFDFCPYCGLNLQDPEEDMRDFGMLGKNELVGQPLIGGRGGFGITDRMISSLMRQLMKTLDKQMHDTGNKAEIQNMPNGINIRFGIPSAKPRKKTVVKKKGITQEQINKMTGLPRVEAKSNVRRFSDKVVYELNATGIESYDDVFISKLESGYEVKAIGKKKVFVNSLPINLPLKGFSLGEKGLTVEFALG